ncbi:MAG: MarR family transcriptional regulator [Gaiellales bacterium]
MQEATVAVAERRAEAWRGFLRAHATLVRTLDRELLEAHGLALTEYEALLLLNAAPDGRLRMSELAERALLSQSGLTRLVDRLERDGLVVRRRCDSDRRGLHAAITEAGRKRYAEATATHLGGVARLFGDRLRPEQLDALAGAWEDLLGPGATASCGE